MHTPCHTWIHTSLPHFKIPFFRLPLQRLQYNEVCWLTRTWTMTSTWVRFSTKTTDQHKGLNILLWARNTFPTAHSLSPFSVWTHQCSVWVICLQMPCFWASLWREQHVCNGANASGCIISRQRFEHPCKFPDPYLCLSGCLCLGVCGWGQYLLSFTHYKCSSSVLREAIWASFSVSCLKRTLLL